MIISDNSKRPSERFIEIVKPYFEQKGYSFKKSAKQFVFFTDNGQKTVGLRFYTTIDLVSANLYWMLTFLPLEKIFATLNGHPKKFKNEGSVMADLLNYSLRRRDDAEYQVSLFNGNLKYDDFSLNNGALKIIALFEKYIEPYFKTHADYFSLEKLFNQLPISSSDLTPYYRKHACFGLILAKYYDREDFQLLVSSYKQYAGQMHYIVKDQMLEIIDKTLQHISNSNIKVALGD